MMEGEFLDVAGPAALRTCFPLCLISDSVDATLGHRFRLQFQLGDIIWKCVTIFTEVGEKS